MLAAPAIPTDDIVILFKGSQEVLERGQTGDPLQGQRLMLVFKKPDLRDSGTGKPVKDDGGFDKEGVRAVTGTDGQATLKVPAEDRALYLSSLGDKPKKHYRIDAVASKNTGSVSEVPRNAKPDLTGGAPQGGNVVAELFKIGDRLFVRRLYSAPYSEKVSLASEEKDDWCRVVEPGPPLGMEPEYPSVLHLDLPEATVKLMRATRRGK